MAWGNVKVSSRQSFVKASGRTLTLIYVGRRADLVEWMAPTKKIAVNLDTDICQRLVNNMMGRTFANIQKVCPGREEALYLCFFLTAGRRPPGRIKLVVKKRENYSARIHFVNQNLAEQVRPTRHAGRMNKVSIEDKMASLPLGKEVSAVTFFTQEVRLAPSPLIVSPPPLFS